MEVSVLQPKISIVVPVYQIENELPHCVESILRQSFSDFQLILVDDGSKDSCPILCDNYAKKDARVICIHKENSGLSSARNVGTAAAQAEWITYIDGDDCIAPSFLEELFLAATRESADIAACPLSSSGIPIGQQDVQYRVFGKLDALKEMLYQKSIDVSACGKLYRTDLIRQFPFPEGCVFEDILPITKTVCAADRVVVLPTPMYGYVQRTGSIMHSTDTRYSEDELTMTNQMLSFVTTHCPDALAAAESKAFSNYCQIFLRLPKKSADCTALRREIKQILRAMAGKILLDQNVRTKNRGAALLSLLNPEFLRCAAHIQ